MDSIILAKYGPVWKPTSPRDIVPSTCGYSNLQVNKLKSNNGLWFDNHDNTLNIIWWDGTNVEALKIRPKDVGFFSAGFHQGGFPALTNKTLGLASWTYWERVPDAQVSVVVGPAEVGETTFQYEHTTGMSDSQITTLSRSIGVSAGAQYKGVSAQVNATMTWTQSEEITITEQNSETRTFKSQAVAAGQTSMQILWRPVRAFAFVDTAKENTISHTGVNLSLAGCYHQMLNVLYFYYPPMYGPESPYTFENAKKWDFAQTASYFPGPTQMVADLEYYQDKTCFDTSTGTVQECK